MRGIDLQLRDYLSTQADFIARTHPSPDLKYSSIAELLLKEGHAFPSDPFTADEIEFLKGAFQDLGRTPKIQECFYNAQSVALQELGLGYAEGMAWREGMPIPFDHAWNVLPSGKPVDVTLRPLGEKNTCNPRKLIARASENLGHTYWGMAFPADEIRKSWFRNKLSLRMLSDDFILNSVLTRGYPKAWRQFS